MTPEATSTNTIWVHLSADLQRFIRARVRDDETTDDLLQDTFLRIHQGLGALQDHDRLAAWVFRIARNVVTDHYRTAGGRPAVFEDDPPGADADHSPENRNDVVADWLPELIDSLPETYRDAVRLHEIEGRSQQDVADQLGLSLSGAKSRVQRGREKLRAALERCCSFELDRRGNVLDYAKRREGGCCE